MEPSFYMVAFMYPASESGRFDLEHYINVHLPLGVGLTKKHLNIKPSRIVVYSSQDDAGASNRGRYAAITSVYFDSKEKAATFLRLFDVAEAAQRLTADYPNYTDHPPEAIAARVLEIPDIDGLIKRFEQELDV